MSALPETWPQLREAERARRDVHLSELQFEAEMAAAVEAREAPTLAAAFEGSPHHLAPLFMVNGRDDARAACQLATSALPRLLAHGDDVARLAPASALEVLSYVALLRALDVDVPDAADGMEQRWLPILVSGRDRWREPDGRTLALACAASGQVDLVADVTGGGPLVPRTTARDIAGPNVSGFARHLAEVIKGHGRADAVDDAWRNVLQLFPLTLASGGVRWIDLTWAALALMVHVEQRPASDVGRWLPSQIAGLE